MKNKKWREFERLAEECYLSMAGMGKGRECWHKAYEVLKEIRADGRSKQPDYSAELYQLDDDTDYCYDIQGWLEDYLDDVDMHEEHERLLKICDELLELFQWEEEYPSDIRFLKASALRNLGRMNDAEEFCRQWLADEPDNIVAATSAIYSSIAVRDLKGAEELIWKYLPEGTPCTEENDVLFTAAAVCYQAIGNKKEKKRIDKALEEYEKSLEEYLLGGDDDDDVDLMWGDIDTEPPF